MGYLLPQSPAKSILAALPNDAAICPLLAHEIRHECPVEVEGEKSESEGRPQVGLGLMPGDLLDSLPSVVFCPTTFVPGACLARRAAKAFT